MLLAALIGWFAGFLATLPMKMFGLAAVAAGDERLLVDYLAYGVLVWALITFGIAMAMLMMVLGPFATLASARWALRYGIIVVIAMPVLLLLTISYRVGWWYGVPPGPFQFRGQLHLDYSIFLLVFCTVSPWMYVRRLRRAISRMDDGGSGPSVTGLSGPA